MLSACSSSTRSYSQTEGVSTNHGPTSPTCHPPPTHLSHLHLPQTGMHCKRLQSWSNKLMCTLAVMLCQKHKHCTCLFGLGQLAASALQHAGGLLVGRVSAACAAHHVAVMLHFRVSWLTLNEARQVIATCRSC